MAAPWRNFFYLFLADSVSSDDEDEQKENNLSNSNEKVSGESSKVSTSKESPPNKKQKLEICLDSMRSIEDFNLYVAELNKRTKHMFATVDDKFRDTFFFDRLGFGTHCSISQPTMYSESVRNRKRD